MKLVAITIECVRLGEVVLMGRGGLDLKVVQLELVGLHFVPTEQQPGAAESVGLS